jgi:hypothetical protein
VTKYDTPEKMARQVRHINSWREKNPERAREIQRGCTIRFGLRKFGLTVEQYDEMLAKQGGGCALCGKTEAENGRRLPVDHCHATGRNRGILCHECNAGLGKLGDTPEALERALAYVRLQ